MIGHVIQRDDHANIDLLPLVKQHEAEEISEEHLKLGTLHLDSDLPLAEIKVVRFCRAEAGPCLALPAILPEGFFQVRRYCLALLLPVWEGRKIRQNGGNFLD